MLCIDMWHLSYNSRSGDDVEWDKIYNENAGGRMTKAEFHAALKKYLDLPAPPAADILAWQQRTNSW